MTFGIEMLLLWASLFSTRLPLHSQRVTLSQVNSGFKPNHNQSHLRILMSSQTTYGPINTELLMIRKICVSQCLLTCNLEHKLFLLGQQGVLD